VEELGPAEEELGQGPVGIEMARRPSYGVE